VIEAASLRTLPRLVRRRGVGASRPPLKSVSKTVLAALFVLLADILLPQQDAYASAEYGFPLLAAVGAAGCIGYLLSAIFRLHRAPLSSRGRLFGSSSAATSLDGGGGGEDWPLLVALLFGSFLMLFSGLGGWVDARPLRISRPALLA
jgi:hypothetical protein